MADQADPAVQQALNETKPGLDEHKLRISRFNDAYDVWRASRPANRSPGLAGWQSRMRVPYAMQTIDIAMVNMAQGQPRCQVLPRQPQYVDNAKAFQKVMDYFTQADHAAEKQVPLTQQGLVYGVTVGKTHWLVKKRTVTGRTWTQNPVTGEQIPGVEQQQITVYDGPSLEPWDVYNAWWDPAGRDVDTCSYVVLRSYLSKDQLLADQCTTPGEHYPNECDGLYHNVDQLIAAGTSSTPPATAQNRLLNSSAFKDKYEVWEIWRDDRLTVIGNQTVLLRDMQNPHWHGQKPVVIANTRPDLFKVAGIPETEVIADLQEGLWTVLNRRFDQQHLTVMAPLTYREGGVIDPGILEVRPRAKWPVTDHDDIRQLPIQPLPPEAYREEEALLATMQLITGINPYVSGSSTAQAGVNQNTATGVSVLQEVASRLLQFKANEIRKKIWQRTFEQWGNDIQQFMSEPLWVRILGPGSEATFEHVGPQEVVGDYDFVLQGTEESLSRAQERTEATQLLQVFAPLIQAGMVNPAPLYERVARAYDFENVSELIPQRQPVPAAAPMNNGQGPQPVPQQGAQLMNGMQHTPLLQQAIGSGYGG